jgi:hypothetical protein
VGLLSDKDKFLFLNRTETIDLVLEGLSKIKLPKPLRLVPLTASSGQNIRTQIRSVLGPTVVAHTTLTDAVSSLKTGGGSIVFVDDNIASGTQASRQLDIFMGGVIEKPQGNYVAEKLDDASSQTAASTFEHGQNPGARCSMEADGSLPPPRGHR